MRGEPWLLRLGRSLALPDCARPFRDGRSYNTTGSRRNEANRDANAMSGQGWVNAKTCLRHCCFLLVSSGSGGPHPSPLPRGEGASLA